MIEISVVTSKTKHMPSCFDRVDFQFCRLEGAVDSIADVFYHRILTSRHPPQFFGNFADNTQMQKI